MSSEERSFGRSTSTPSHNCSIPHILGSVRKGLKGLYPRNCSSPKVFELISIDGLGLASHVLKREQTMNQEDTEKKIQEECNRATSSGFDHVYCMQCFV